MRSKATAVVLALASLLFASACSSADVVAPSDPLQEALAGDPIPLVRLRSEPYSFTYNSGIADSTRLIVRDAETWTQIWKKIWRPHSPLPPVPAVDFGREMIVVAGLGTRSSGGYSIIVDSALRQKGTIRVVIRKESPGKNCAVTGALTQPVDIARLPRSSDPVHFHEKSFVRDCG